MANYTTNLSLKKPVDADGFDIEDFNGNAEKIDAAFGAGFGQGGAASVSQTISAFTKGTMLTNSQDLDTILKIGKYSTTGGSTIASLVHKPSSITGGELTLFVFSHSALTDFNSNVSYGFQVLYNTYNGIENHWYRSISDGNCGNWYSPSEQLTSIEEISASKNAGNYPKGIFPIMWPSGVTIAGVTANANLRGVAYNTGNYLHATVTNVNTGDIYTVDLNVATYAVGAISDNITTLQYDSLTLTSGTAHCYKIGRIVNIYIHDVSGSANTEYTLGTLASKYRPLRKANVSGSANNGGAERLGFEITTSGAILASKASVDYMYGSCCITYIASS